MGRAVAGVSVAIALLLWAGLGAETGGATSLTTEREAAISSIKNGDAAGARVTWQRLISNYASDPCLPATAADIAQAWWRQKEYSKSRDAYQYVTTQWPQNEAAIRSSAGVAVACLKLGDEGGADAAVKVLLAHPAAASVKASALVKVGEEYVARRQTTKSEPLFDKVLATASSDSEGKSLKLRVYLGKALAASQAKNDAAIALCVDKINGEFSPAESGDTLVSLARACKDEGLFERSRTTYLQALAGNQGTSAGLAIETELVKVDMAAGDKAAALAGVDRVVAAYAGDAGLPQALRKLGTEYRQRNLGRSEEIAEISAAKIKGIVRLRALASSACAHIENADGKAADAIVETMKTEAKGDIQASLCLMPVASAYLADEGSAITKAAELFRWIKGEQGPVTSSGRTVVTQPVFYVDLCDTLLAVKKGQSDAASAIRGLRSRYAGWAEMPGEMLRAMRKAGVECWKEGCVAKDTKLFLRGAQMCEAIISEYPGWNGLPTVYYFAAANRSCAGENAKSLELLQTALAKFPDLHHQAEILHRMGGCHEALGDIEKAAYFWVKAVDADPAHEFAWQGLSAAGKAYERLGQDGRMGREAADAAIGGCYKRIVDGYPACPESMREDMVNWLKAHEAQLTSEPQ